jgi:hypothetical protein
MRKILLLFVFFQAAISFSQTYYHFPTSNTTWFETYHNQYGNSYQYTYVMLNSDTVINGKLFHNLYRPNTYWPYDNVNIGCIREDSLKRVFIFDYTLQTEFLLYDFSKSIGETIIFMPAYRYSQLVITDIDTVLINNSYRRRFYTSAGFSQGYEVWVEGIVSYRGLLSQMTDLVTCMCWWELNCMKEHDTMYCLPQTLVSVTDNSDIQKYKVDIYPNPASSTIEISFDESYELINIQFFNLQGKLIAHDEYSNCKNIHFNRSNLENGLYFLKIIMDKSMYYTEKIILIE